MVDVSKVREYFPNPAHSRGRHKARVFASALGLRAGDAHVLRDALLSAALVNEAVASGHDEYGVRYVLDFDMSGAGGSASVRSSWIVRTGEDFPRLTSCYVL